MGLTMTGADLTASYVRKARRLAREAGVDVRFHTSDMREIQFEGEFHAAFNWFSSFGYFSDADNLQVCRRVLRALKPGGRFLIEGVNKSWLLSHLKEVTVQTIGGVHIRSRSAWDGRKQRVVSRWTLRRGRVLERRSFSVRIFNAREIRELLGQAGFCAIELYGHPPTGRLSRHSRRLIAVGRRPGGTSGGYRP
jgi:SAM-dependent methyltransferase